MCISAPLCKPHGMKSLLPVGSNFSYKHSNLYLNNFSQDTQSCEIICLIHLSNSFLTLLILLSNSPNTFLSRSCKSCRMIEVVFMPRPFPAHVVVLPSCWPMYQVGLIRDSSQSQRTASTCLCSSSHLLVGLQSHHEQIGFCFDVTLVPATSLYSCVLTRPSVLLNLEPSLVIQT